MTCVVVICSGEGYGGRRWDVCPVDVKKIDGDGIWSDDVVLEVVQLVEILELEEDGWG